MPQLSTNLGFCLCTVHPPLVLEKQTNDLPICRGFLSAADNPQEGEQDCPLLEILTSLDKNATGVDFAGLKGRKDWQRTGAVANKALFLGDLCEICTMPKMYFTF